MAGSELLNQGEPEDRVTQSRRGASLGQLRAAEPGVALGCGGGFQERTTHGRLRPGWRWVDADPLLRQEAHAALHARQAAVPSCRAR